MSKKNRNRPVANRPAVAVAAPKPRAPLFLWIVLLLALVIKLLYLKSSFLSPFYEPMLLDPKYYHDWALRLVRGQWDTGVFYGLPLYPYFLALCYKISGASTLFVKFAQITLGMLTVFLVYKTAERLRGVTAGVLAALFAAFYGPLFFHEGIFIPEALGLPLYALAFLLVLNFLEKNTIRNAIYLAVVAGFATLTKAGLLIFMSGLFFTLAFRVVQKKRAALPLFFCVLFYFGTLFPITLHNWFRGKDAVLLTSHAGFNFYIGNNPNAEGVFKAPEGTGTNVEAQMEDSRTVAEKALGRKLKPSEVSKYWSNRAWEFIRQNPEKFFKLCGRKLVLFFDSREISDVDDYQFCATFNDFLRLPWMNFGLLCPILFAGMAALFWDPKYRGVSLAWLGAYLVGLISFFVNARYRLPLLPLFFVVGAIGVVDLAQSVKRGQFGKATLILLAAALGFFISQAHLVNPDGVRDATNAGDALLEKKDFEGAKEFYQTALRINPDSAKANLAMGLTLTREGSYAEAKEYYEKAITADPQSWQAYNSLGLWYDREGNLSEAEKCFLKTLDLKPDSAQAHNNLGMVYGKEGRSDAAIQEFETSLKLNPASARATTNLGLVLHHLGRKKEARDLWVKALTLDPDFAEAKKALELMGGETSNS